MTRQDAARFSSSLAAMAALFEKEPVPQVVEIYFRALERFSIGEVEEGISKACSTMKFFPKPVELIDCITGGTGNLADKAMVEACRVLEAIKSVGTYVTVCFDDAVTQAVIVQQFGGWAKFGDMLADAEKWFIKDFCAGYQAFSRQNVRHYGALPGWSHMQNALTGREREETPVYIGDVEKAKAIHAQGKLTELPAGEGYCGHQVLFGPDSCVYYDPEREHQRQARMKRKATEGKK